MMVTVGLSAALTQTAVASRTTRITFAVIAVNFIFGASCFDMDVQTSVFFARNQSSQSFRNTLRMKTKRAGT